MERKIEDMTLRLTPASLAHIGNRYVNGQMDIFHIKMAVKIFEDNIAVMDEDGLAEYIGENFRVQAWPPRVFAETGLLTTCSLN